ncbi:MAG: caspase family protein, partial [Egibacteraceae bacterium]
MTKAALLVASSDYQDQKFQQLRAPAHDVGALARVLDDPAIGGFDVHTLLNEPSWQVSEEIEAFFADRKPDDPLLLYFSCHGVKDASGKLYFASKNTKFPLLAATGISSGWVNERMDSSRSRRIVLLLDCCYSGAFARGLTHKGTEGVDVEEFGGRGRAVITASKAMEYAYEGDTLTMDVGQPSVFTRALVHGLETGEADLDGDGRVGVNELYDYVYDRVRKTTSQTPTMSAHGLEGELYLARNPRPPPPPVTPVPLPFELRQAVESEIAWQRAGAVTGLKRLL